MKLKMTLKRKYAYRVLIMLDLSHQLNTTKEMKKTCLVVRSVLKICFFTSRPGGDVTASDIARKLAYTAKSDLSNVKEVLADSTRKVKDAVNCRHLLLFSSRIWQAISFKN